MQSGSKSFSIPEANSTKILIDLNFFKPERDASRLNKRIVFRKGTITIERFTQDTLILNFDGEGSGMMERGDSFKISGTINISY